MNTILTARINCLDGTIENNSPQPLYKLGIVNLVLQLFNKEKYSKSIYKEITSSIELLTLPKLMKKHLQSSPRKTNLDSHNLHQNIIASQENPSKNNSVFDNYWQFI